MPSVLFVCTGNIFRSMVAEYALKLQLGRGTAYRVGSAGIRAEPQAIPGLIHDHLLVRGVDASLHMQRKLTEELLDQTDLVVSMGLDHREFIRNEFGREAPLFNRICYQRDDPILDVHEAIPDWERNLESTRAYVISVIDHIWESAPVLFTKLSGHFTRD